MSDPSRGASALEQVIHRWREQAQKSHARAFTLYGQDAAAYETGYADARGFCAQELEAVLAARVAPRDDPWLKDAPPEELDDACHCGTMPEGNMVWGTKCPIIEHRARSGKQWRDEYIEQELGARVAPREAPELLKDLRELEQLYNRDKVAHSTAGQIERIFDKWLGPSSVSGGAD